MKKEYSTTTIIITAVLTLLVIGTIGFALWSQSQDNPPETSQTTSPTNDDQQPQMHVDAIAIDTQGLRDFIDNQMTGFVYIGRPTCSHCAKFTPILNEVVGENNYTNVYFYDTDEARAVNVDEFSAILQELGINSVPKFIFFRDGVEVAHLTNTEDKQALVDFFVLYQQ